MRILDLVRVGLPRVHRDRTRNAISRQMSLIRQAGNEAFRMGAA